MHRAAALLLLATRDAVIADVYMQTPPGANNRLAEGGGNRNNNNRLMDSQNNAKGGYGYGGNANSQNTGMGTAETVKYYAGSELPVTWTAQHSCGAEAAECQIVIQYMCNDVDNTPPTGGPFGPQAAANNANEGPIRDGTNGGTPNPNNANADTGLHEPASFYNACAARKRNQGLYTADQNLNSNRATRTRQNPNGARSGLECAEERDYYPYWGASPWKDLAILTNNLALCDWYKSESQNVKARGYCNGNSNGGVPWEKTDCEANGGAWVEVAAHNIPAPECYAAPETRDNHLGNDRTGAEVVANIKIPTLANGANQANAVDDAERCVIRLRYNITTADTRVCSAGTEGGAKSPYTTEEECKAQGGTWSAFNLDSKYDIQNADDDDVGVKGTPPLPDGNPKVGAGACTGSTDCPSGSQVLQGTGGTNSILELAVNTNQYGRTFQDRSHVFSIQSRPPAIPANQVIKNLNVAGKRGNIVQTYPATEYRFAPEELNAGRADLVHFQWTGNDNTNNNGNNNGEGTDNEDRHNIVQFDNKGVNVPAADSATTSSTMKDMFDVEREINTDTGTFTGARPRDELVKQFALAKQTGCATANNVNNDQQTNNCEKLNRELPTVDLGLLQMKPGTFKYMSSRNNNFSNRAQKGSITVSSEAHTRPPPPLDVQVQAVPGPSSENGKVVVTWQPPGQTNPDGTFRAYVGTDGEKYWGVEQDAQMAASYRVQYSEDGGQHWHPTNCITSCSPPDCQCEIDGLKAGTPIAVRVRSAGAGGMSLPSAVGVAQTEHSSSSRECDQKLQNEADGNFVSPGATAAIVIGCIAGAALLACAGWIFLCGGKEYFARHMRPPPPPPPGGKFEGGMAPPAY